MRFFLTLALLFTLAACGDQTDDTGADTAALSEDTGVDTGALPA